MRDAACAPRKVVCGPGSYWGGRRFAPTPLRCSPGGGAAELATRPAGAALRQPRRVSSRSAPVLRQARPPPGCAPHRPRSRPVRRPPSAGDTSGLINTDPHAAAVRVFGYWHTVSRKGACGCAGRRASVAPRSAVQPAARLPKDRRASLSDLPRLSEQSERSERREFRGRPAARASQGSRREATTATVARRPAHPQAPLQRAEPTTGAQQSDPTWIAKRPQ
ncbi:hypothetical protein RA8CHR_04831 [Variovorax sp. RA8]|nr:hypothetical protein RA8CHR_04831 [Variovorax sp. RA8]